MVDTAQYVNERIKDRVVVLTGSLKPAIFIDNDAIFNIASAFNAVQTLSNGVYIIMNGQIFDPTNVQKNVEKNCFEKIS
jgi:L-asparaginase